MAENTTPSSKTKWIWIALAALFVLFAVLCFTHVICLWHDWRTATCTEPETCIWCGKTRGVPLDHTLAIDPEVIATCTEPGLTEGVHCSVCGEVLLKQEVVPMHGHTIEPVPAVAPTCTEPGLTEGTRCFVCGEVREAQQEIPALGHTIVTDEAKAPTCTKPVLTMALYTPSVPPATMIPALLGTV